MMNSGFIINKLRLTGGAVRDAQVIFTRGANIISGPSDTGKTFIFQCINYMLGSSKTPKKIKEVTPYSKIYLEITSYDEITYTLESDLKGGDFHLYKCKIDEITFNQNYDTLSRKHNPNSEETISAFLLKINNTYPQKIRTHVNGKTRQISYRDIVRFILINEERIITEDSLIESHYTKATEEKNVMKYIVSGQDDSDIIAVMSKDEITNKRGRLELLKELIIEAENDIDKVKEDSSDESLEQLIQRIEELKNTYQKISQDYKELSSQRNDLSIGYETCERKRRELEELYKRSNLLKTHYETDIKRLKSTIEVSLLLKDNNEESTYCPLCKNKIPHDCDVNIINNIIDSCNAEIEKINGLLLELMESVSLILSEKKEVDAVINDLSSKKREIEDKLENDLSVRLKNILELIDSLNKKKSYLLGINIKQAQVQNYIFQKEKLEIILSSSKKGNRFETLTTANMFSISEKLENVLKGINYPNLAAVSYSEDKSDFVISGKDRSLFGKGYRAIIYASFIVAIQELLADRHYSIGIPVLDSPLVTYKKPNNNNEEIPIDLAMDFYRYISNNNSLNQIIIIENEEPPQDILKDINHIVFTGTEDNGRCGFIPT